MKKLWIAVVFILCGLAAYRPLELVRAEEPSATELLPILISEIQVRGSVINENDETSILNTHEFVELYNPNDEPISLHEWKLEFTNTSGSSSRFLAQFRNDSDTTYEIEAQSFFIISRELYLPAADYFFETGSTLGLNISGGSLKLLNANTEAIDLVGYGPVEEGLYLGAPAMLPGVDQSIYRCMESGGTLIDTQNNHNDFTLGSSPSPGAGDECLGAPEETEDEEPDEESLSDTTDEGGGTLNCSQVVISELFANPEGAATGKQYVEIYNPSPGFQNLTGCGLQTTHSQTIYWLKDIELAPEEYRAFYDSETGLWLTISSGGTVYLIDQDEIEIQSVTYPAAMPDDSAWAWFGNDTWALTYALTPGGPNLELALKPCPEGQERNPETNRCRSVVIASNAQLVSCGLGRERNPETNRCRNATTAQNTLADCGPGRERNPATNRCRNIIQVGNELADCGPGRERNPETNRCRNIASNTSGLVPCAPGQERNPETNRCRKVALPNNIAITGIADIPATTTPIPGRWWLVGFTALFAGGYGVWEWRYDVRNWFKKSKI